MPISWSVYLTLGHAYLQRPCYWPPELGCQGKIRSTAFGSPANPKTQAPSSVDHEAMATSSYLRTRTGVPSSGAASIDCHASSGSSGLIVVIKLRSLGIFNLNMNQVRDLAYLFTQ